MTVSGLKWLRIPMLIACGCLAMFSSAAQPSALAPQSALPAPSTAPVPAIAVPPLALPSNAGPPAPPEVIARVAEKPISFADLPPPRRFVTRDQIAIGGRKLSYTATAGETYIANAWGEPIASFFSFSYVKDDPFDPRRPVMFAFNGGPGSASIWLHVGAFGPKRVVLDRGINPMNTPPFGLRDNADSVLDVADLVFIDPVGTGYSHAVGNARDADFAGVDADAEAVARFMEAWLTENGRWNSPKYLVGESYGSVRAAVLARALIGGPFYTTFMRGITLDGIVLVGALIDGGARGQPVAGARAATDPDTGAGLAVPGFAATAWYHGRIERAGRSVAQFHDEAKEFGTAEYADALRRLRNGKLTPEEQQRIAARLAAFTGVPAEVWLRADLKLSANAFGKHVLEPQGLEVGMYDGRYTLPIGGIGDPIVDDPAMGRYVPGFVAAFHAMLREDLRVQMPYPYASIAFGWAFRWNFARTGVPDDHTFAHDIATSMHRTPRLRLLVCSGYYDLVTPPTGAEAAIAAAKLPMERVTFRNYESGHMLYLGGTASQFANDLRAFVKAGAQ